MKGVGRNAEEGIEVQTRENYGDNFDALFSHTFSFNFSFILYLHTSPSGRITKMFNIVDLRDSSMWKNDSAFFKCLGDSSKHSEKVGFD